MAHRAREEAPGKYRAVGGTQVSFLSLQNFVQIFYFSRNSLPPSLPSFDVVDETGQEGMSRRAEKRLPERTGKYRAIGGAQVRRPVGTRPAAACGAWPRGVRGTARRRGPRRWSSGRSDRMVCFLITVFSLLQFSCSKSATTAMILHLSQLQGKKGE